MIVDMVIAMMIPMIYTGYLIDSSSHYILWSEFPAQAASTMVL